jgi:hypothetical protein
MANVPSKARPKKVDELPTYEFTRAKPRSRKTAARKESKEVLFGIGSLKDVLHATRELIAGTDPKKI